jgi:hypothetical protein
MSRAFFRSDRPLWATGLDENHLGGETMLENGTRVVMTKGYRGVPGVITGTPDSMFEFYVISLENGINIVAGPSAFEVKK